MPRIRDHMIFMLYGEAGIHCGDHVRRYAVAATLRRPELDRHFDPLKAVSGKHQGKRVDEDGGFDARVMGERLRGEFFAVDLLSDMARGLLAYGGSESPIRIGADEYQTCVAAARKTKETDAAGIYAGRGRRCADHKINEPFYVVRTLDENRQIVGTANIGGRVAGMIDGGRDKAGIRKC